MGRTLTQITLDFAHAEKEAAIKMPAASIPEENDKVVKKEKLQKNEPSVEVKEQPKAVSARGRRSLKSMTQETDKIKIPDDETLFKKQYYPIGEVAAMFSVNQSLIRYWETEFDILKPKKNRKGDRFFRPIDVKNLVLIHDLLRRRKFTIEGAKEYLKKNKRAEEKFAATRSLENLKLFLQQLKSGL
ncbi:MAG: MerR family transcriptional regulator [Chitinophagaceae bacterium]|jgi:DNA-binding transcriptional MerR regulator|nr:MerR family transcriptional regulator [Chitinophagaceae bacterium]